MEFTLINRLSVLSHPQRMELFRLLMRRCPDALAAGEIAQALELKPSTASVYLSALTQAGLISQRRDKTRLLYAINLDAARSVVSGLFTDCCGGRPDLCDPNFSPKNPKRRQNVLFLCTGNSARSIMAEAILRDVSPKTFMPFSAGRAERSEINPRTIRTLHQHGHDTAGLRSKNMAEFQRETAPQMDFVFTVCDMAANEACPSWPGNPIGSHWGVPDPVAAIGTSAEQHIAFNRAYQMLKQRITAFVALPFDALDRAAQQTRIDDIARTTHSPEVTQT